MPKRRRLFTPNKHKIMKSIAKVEIKEDSDTREYEPRTGGEVNTARGRFMGALQEILEPTPREDSDSSPESSPEKRDRQSTDIKEYQSDEEESKNIRQSPPRQSYVLKLFDRSVDLSQFRDDSPLYPICRAWMVNQPKADYNKFEAVYREELSPGGVELPGPEGPPVAKVPKLLPAQRAANKNNINLNYRLAIPPTREKLLRGHLKRWAAVKQAWQEQILLKEARYESTQRVLNRINLEYPTR